MSQSEREQDILQLPVSTREVKKMMRRIYKPFERRILTRPQELIRSQLGDYQGKLTEMTGKLPSRPMVCAQYIFTELFICASRYGMERLEVGDSTGRFWYDFSYRMPRILTRIALAESERRGNLDPLITGAVTTVGNLLETKLTDQAEHFMEMQAEASKDARLLREDPSGFLLVDNCVQEIKDRTDKSPKPQVPEFVIAGVELTARVYRTIYPLTEQL